MPKIMTSKVKCACCNNTVYIDRVFSFSSENIGLSGNKHDPLQYRMEECPECHYTSLDIEDRSVRVSKGMLNAFRIKKGMDSISDPSFVSILKAADIYDRNKDYDRYSYTLRLASFFAEELRETSVSRELLRQANEALQTYFENIDELTHSDIMLAIILIDGNRRLGMFATARELCKEILALINGANAGELNDFRRLIEFETALLEKRDIAEHLIREVL